MLQEVATLLEVIMDTVPEVVLQEVVTVAEVDMVTLQEVAMKVQEVVMKAQEVATKAQEADMEVQEADMVAMVNQEAVTVDTEDTEMVQEKIGMNVAMMTIQETVQEATEMPQEMVETEPMALEAKGQVNQETVVLMVQENQEDIVIEITEVLVELNYLNQHMTIEATRNTVNAKNAILNLATPEENIQDLHPDPQAVDEKDLDLQEGIKYYLAMYLISVFQYINKCSSRCRPDSGVDTGIMAFCAT